MCQFYRDYWKKRAHILAPLTSLTKVPPKQFKKNWTPACDKALAEVKAMVTHDVLLAFPDPNKTFDIETDASDYQLGAMIMQE